MEFIQSRYQDVFSRLYEMICHAIWFVVIALISSLIFSSDFNVLTYLEFSFIFTFGIISYLFVMHRGASKLIRISEDKFVYIDYKTVTEINWEDYQGYKISKTIPYQVVIKNRVYGETRFSYYAFSSLQRKQILEILHNQ